VAVADEEEEADIRARLKEVIDVQIADAGVLRKTLTVTVPRDSIAAELDKEYRQLIAEATVPGFRRGRAPRRLVEKRFGGEVGAQVQVRLVSNAYLAAVDKAELKVLGDPMVWTKPKDKGRHGAEGKDQLMDMPTALQTMKLPEDGDLEFRCEVEIKPEFTLPPLEGVKVEQPEVRVTEEDITEQINRVRKRRGNWMPVSDGAVELDDLLICDLEETLGDGEPRKLENVQLSARPQLIEDVAIEDFGERMKGARPGEKRRFEGEIPADHAVEALRGKKARFEITLNEIKRLSLPPLDAGYLASMGFDSEAEYREFVRRMMEGQIEHEIKRGMRNQVKRYLLERTSLDVPEGLSSRQTERAVLRRKMELKRQGVPDSEIEKMADELRTIAGEQAVVELKLYFILEEIAEKMEIEVSEEEINAQIAAIAREYNVRFDRVRDELIKTGQIESLYLVIRDEKCLDKILEKAEIVKTDLSKRDAATADDPRPKAARKSEKKS